ncbi:hypothetical protein J1614_002396 [Plenodomus biglobosus]|nr:hypothetical protein J1614_002396 [Plenodomus biglobosus]
MVKYGDYIGEFSSPEFRAVQLGFKSSTLLSGDFTFYLMLRLGYFKIFPDQYIRCVTHWYYPEHKFVSDYWRLNEIPQYLNTIPPP